MNPIIDQLMHMLDHRDTTTYLSARKAAYDTIQQLDPEIAMTFLTPALYHTDPLLRREAVDALRLLHNSRATKALYTLLGDSDYLVRAGAIRALSQREGPDIVPTLIGLLDDPEEYVQASAIAALGTYNDLRAIPHIIAILRPGTYTSAAVALSRLYQNRAIDDLLIHLHNSDPTIRAGIAMALGRLALPIAVSPLLSCLQDPDPRVRSEALTALGQIKDARAVDALIGALKDSDPAVRYRAGWALTAFNDPRVFEPLLQALDDPIDNSGICAALANFGDPAFFALLQLLDVANPNTRRQAIHTLAGSFSTHAAWADPTLTAHAWQRLTELLQTADIPTQEYVLNLFRFIGDRRAMPHVLGKLTDLAPQIRWCAVLALIQLGDLDALPALELMSSTDDGTIETLGSGRIEILTLRDEAKRAIYHIRERQQYLQ